MSAQTIAPQAALKLAESGQPAEIIDVRTPAEYASLHVVGARSIPLDMLDPCSVMSARNGSTDKPLYVICKSGGRAAKACEKFQAAGFANIFSIEGGTEAWERAGLPVVRGTVKTISLERQVRILAGLLVLIGVALGWLVHPAFYGLSAFIGAGLTFAGLTDWCGMGMLLARMSWNRKTSGTTRSP
jgi:rhodanese-related sulfurtransferase